MKKIFFTLVALTAAVSMNAQSIKLMKNGEVVAVYSAAEADGVEYEEEPTTAATTGTARRTGGIYVNWVQLWENGPKFAEYNVGVTDGKAESTGGHYCWGSSIDKDPNKAYKGGSDPLTGDDDTATKLWGKNWRMPTRAELQALVDNCNQTKKYNYNGSGMTVVIYTGKGDYENNSVVLPAAGYFSGRYDDKDVFGWYGDVFYWSSDPLIDNGDFRDAYELYSLGGVPEIGASGRVLGECVRAVLSDMDSQSFGTPGLSEDNEFEF